MYGKKIVKQHSHFTVTVTDDYRQEKRFSFVSERKANNFISAYLSGANESTNEIILNKETHYSVK